MIKQNVVRFTWIISFDAFVNDRLNFQLNFTDSWKVTQKFHQTFDERKIIWTSNKKSIESNFILSIYLEEIRPSSITIVTNLERHEGIDLFRIDKTKDEEFDSPVEFLCFVYRSKKLWTMT